MILTNVLNILMDTRCILCDESRLSEDINFICDNCLKVFNNTIDKKCSICGHPLNHQSVCISCSKLGDIHYDNYNFIQYYTGFFKKIILMLKKNDNYMIIKLFYKLIIYKNMIDKNGVITSVPDSIYKRFKKGRSSLYFLLDLLKKANYKVIKNIYKRKVFSMHSQKMKNEKRRINEIKKIYFLPKRNIKKFNGIVYLIDDVYTTGATLNYGSKLLKKAGFENVKIITFFRARLNNQ